jgi:hypothetical protein
LFALTVIVPADPEVFVLVEILPAFSMTKFGVETVMRPAFPVAPKVLLLLNLLRGPEMVAESGAAMVMAPADPGPFVSAFMTE